MRSSFDRQLRPCSDICRFWTPPPAAEADSSPLTAAAHRADSASGPILERITLGESLKVLLAHEGGPERRRLHDSLTSAECGTRCIRRAVFLAGCLFVLSLEALAYCAALLPELVSDRVHFLTKGLSLVCLASFISEVEFLGYWLWHRISVNRLHQECRRRLLPLVGSQPIAPRDGVPVLPSFGKGHFGQ